MEEISGVLARRATHAAGEERRPGLFLLWEGGESRMATLLHKPHPHLTEQSKCMATSLKPGSWGVVFKSSQSMN